jgi:3-oxoacid CoA-transferase subunit A/glutaconate CoA-transferase subunit A
VKVSKSVRPLESDLFPPQQGLKRENDSRAAFSLLEIVSGLEIAKPVPEARSTMEVVMRGEGPLLGWHDPDEQRKWIRENKPRRMTDKRMDIKQAVSRFVSDGDLLAMGGFGHVRVSMAAIYEMIRQKKRNITLSGKTATHDCDLLLSSGVVSRIEVAYSFGHELRGLSPASRRMAEQGRVEVLGEVSNAGIQWRFKAAAMGLPFLPSRVMLGTGTFTKSSSLVVRDPLSGKNILLLPACYPDVSFIHVHRCDRFGNSQIDGVSIMDWDLARAARRLVITTEEIVDDDVIRSEPSKTIIPFYCVDAVAEVPYGSHPANMPFLYYSDEEHIGEWLKVSRTDAGVEDYFRKYVHGVKDFGEYIELVGGRKKMDRLKDIELLRAQTTAPWAE